MSCNSQLTLIKALELSIERISNNFNGKWLILGNNDEGCISGHQDKKDNWKYNVSFPSEYHAFVEVCICVSGCFAVELMTNIYKINEGEACIIFPGTIHSELYANEADHLAIWIVFNSNRIRVHLSGNIHKEFCTTDLRTLIPDYEYNNITNNINMENKNENAFSNRMYKLYVLHILLITLKKISMEVPDQAEREKFKKKIVEEIKGFIETYGLKYVHLRDISQELYISAGYLNSIFKSVTGFTVMQYIENRRIEKAMCLLSNTKESINNISKQLGYYDQYHFSKSFKKATKYSPSQYRKAALG